MSSIIDISNNDWSFRVSTFTHFMSLDMSTKLHFQGLCTLQHGSAVATNGSNIKNSSGGWTVLEMLSDIVELQS